MEQERRGKGDCLILSVHGNLADSLTYNMGSQTHIGGGEVVAFFKMVIISHLSCGLQSQ